MNYFPQICNIIMALDLCLDFVHYFISAKYLEHKLISFYHCTCVGIDTFLFGEITCHFSQICNSVMAPD